MKQIVWLSLIMVSMAHAELQLLDNDDLRAEDGQGGADISLMLSLNHTDAAGTETYQLSNYCITNYKLCRYAIAINNRYDDGSYVDRSGVVHEANGSTAGATLGKKIWLVFKGIQGTVNLQYLGLDGTDLIYLNDSSVSVTKAAIKFSFDPARPILLRNVGFTALSVETDTVDNEGGGNVPGYLAVPTAGTGLQKTTNGKYDYSTAFTAGGRNYNNSSFDHGKDTGFNGINILGNLVVAGSLKVFSCDASHPRC